jgi:hypothetical protein
MKPVARAAAPGEAGENPIFSAVDALLYCRFRCIYS